MNVVSFSLDFIGFKPFMSPGSSVPLEMHVFDLSANNKP